MSATAQLDWVLRRVPHRAGLAPLTLAAAVLVASPVLAAPQATSQPKTETAENGASADARGLEIFREADRRQSGYVDMLVRLKMVLRNRQGDAVERELDLKQLEVPDGGDKLMVVFNTPKAIRGTALLSHGQLAREDDQWLYLPALRRVKKIASRNRSGPFLGSEFSYEDLSTQEVAKYTYKFLREDDCPEVADSPQEQTTPRTDRCFIVERRPGPNLYSGYLRQVFWIHSEDYRSLKVDYYNRGDRLTKTLVSSDFSSFRRVDPAQASGAAAQVSGAAAQVSGAAAQASGSTELLLLKASRMLMRNHVTGKSTELQWSDFQFGTGLSAERDLSVTSLRRVR